MVGEEDAIRRARLVLSLRQDGIMDRRLLSAVERTDRTRYCPEAFAARAYEDRQIPIDCGQTMEPARRVAIMLSALEVGERHHVLEIGTGSGYATALLARSARRVVSLDRYRTLVEGARVALKKDGITNAEIVLGDGHHGWPSGAPFERIFVSAACDPVPAALIEELAPGGKLIAPIGGEENGAQTLVLFTRSEDGLIESEPLGPAFAGRLGSGIARAL